METPILDGIPKVAVLDVVLPGAAGYYLSTRGGKVSDSAIKGALIGGGVGTISSAGDVLSGDIGLDTITSPATGALRGGLSAMGGHLLLPILLQKLRHTNWSESGKKAVDAAKSLMGKLDDIAAQH
jgi:hypothetical protein